MNQSKDLNFKRVMIIATTFSFHERFNFDNIKLLKEMGCEVHIVANDTKLNRSELRLNNFYNYCHENGIIIHEVDLPRSPYRIIELCKAYVRIRNIIKSINVDLIHSHTPVGGILGRLISIGFSITNIYTVHGFHFFKGAPLINWILFFPVERFLSLFTDEIITINKDI